MAFEELLDHKCAIYHMATQKTGMGFGIETDSFVYADEPDLPLVPCHFNVGDMGTLEQTEDAKEYTVVGKVNFPIGTDVRINDKIVDLSNGMEYYAELPRPVRDHHVIVRVQRKGKIKGAI